MFERLNHDCWAAVGHCLDPVSVACLSMTSVGLQHDISSNSALWRGLAKKRWPALFADSSSGSVDSITDWYGVYQAAHKASCRLATHQPWTANITSTRSNPAPSSAQLLLSNSIHQVATKNISTSSSTSSSPVLTWQRCTCVAAAFSNRLHFWRWTAQADLHPPFVGRPSASSQGSSSTDQTAGQRSTSPAAAAPAATAATVTLGAAVAEGTAAAGPAEPWCDHWFSDSSHNHSTGPVSVMIEVPTGGLLPGFATGSVDTTIKLWTPFSTTSGSSSRGSGGGSADSSSSSPGVPIRPCRTLTGHTDRITALACMPSLGHGVHSMGMTSSSSGGSSSAGAPVLVSGSADKTIKLWSLASIQRSSPSAAAAATFATIGTPRSSCSGSCAGEGRRHAVRRGGQQKQQQARNPLLGTLRGHSGAVCSLLPWPPAWQNADASCYNSGNNTAPAAGGLGAVSSGSNGSSNGSSNGGSSGGSGGSLLSGSRDSRVKLWDVCEGRQSCVATWRLPGSCRQLLGGLEMPGCVVVMLDRSLQVLDLRVPSVGSAVTHGVLTLSWPRSAALSTAAVRGTVIAAGARDAVRAWDLRAAHSSSTNSTSITPASSSSGNGCRLLLSGSMPHGAHVSHLQLDSVKLVAACNRPKLHSAAGIAVWDLATGNRLELQASCLSGINLHPTSHPYSAASQALHCSFGGAHEAMQQLIDQLSDSQAEEAVAIRSGEVLPGAAGNNHADAAEWDNSSDAGSVGEAGGGFEASLNESGDDSSSDDDDSSSEASSGGGFGQAGSAVVGMQGSLRGGCKLAEARSGEGCVEPGVLALAMQGPLIACIDSLGNFLLRDFAAGVPGTELLQNFAAHSFSAADGSGSGAVGYVGFVGGGASAPTGVEKSAGAVVGAGSVDVDKGIFGQLSVREAESAERGTTVAAAAAAEQLSKLKFWRQ